MTKQYENTIVTFTTQPAIDVLNDMGADGWEPYAVTKTAVYFKRPVPEKSTVNPPPDEEEINYTGTGGFENPFDDFKQLWRDAMKEIKKLDILR